MSDARRPLRIYVASSWRNAEQPLIVEMLRQAGHEVYDFRHPNLGRGQADGFRWSDIDPEWESWTPEAYRAALEHPVALDGFGADKGGMDWADVCVMVAPCGRSAHSEAAYMAGQGKPSFVLLRPGEPELMYRLFTRLVITDEELLAALAECTLGTFEAAIRLSVLAEVRAALEAQQDASDDGRLGAHRVVAALAAVERGTS